MPIPSRKILLVALQVALLCVFWKIGDLIHTCWLPSIPGSVIGLGLVFGLLRCRIIPVRWLDIGANLLIGELLLFFVPTVLGVLQYTGLLRAAGLPMVALIVVSTSAAMLTTGLVVEWFARKAGAQHV